MTLRDFLKGIADAIRYVDGSTAEIPAPDYEARIIALGSISNAVLEALNATENGTYTPSEGVDGFSSVTVNVETDEPVLAPLEATENGTYNPEEGVDGFSSVVVNVEAGTADVVLEAIEITENGTYAPQAGVDGFGEVVVNVPSDGGLYDFFAGMGYTVLFADGVFYNTDLVTVEIYEMTVNSDGRLQAASGVNGAGFYTRGASGYTIDVFARFPEATAYYTQYGTATTTATLPTIQTAGTGRKSYSTLTGAANRLQTYAIGAGDYEAFLGTNTDCILEIIAIVIRP